MEVLELQGKDGMEVRLSWRTIKKNRKSWNEKVESKGDAYSLSSSYPDLLKFNSPNSPNYSALSYHFPLSSHLLCCILLHLLEVYETNLKSKAYFQLGELLLLLNGKNDQVELRRMYTDSILETKERREREERERRRSGFETLSRRNG